MTVEIKKVNRHNSALWIEYGFEKDGKNWSGRCEVRNPIHMLTNENFDATAQARLLEEFETFVPKVSMNDRIEFANEEEREAMFKKLDGAIDKYYEYIDNYRQWEQARKGNDRLYTKMDFLAKNEHIPQTINKAGYETLIEQAFGIIKGLAVRCDELTVAHTIRWIKKLGFQLSKCDKENQVAYYTFTKLGEDWNTCVAMCYEIKKVKGQYKVRFLYETPSVARMNDGYGAVYKSSTAREIDKDTTRYSSVSFY